MPRDISNRQGHVKNESFGKEGLTVKPCARRTGHECRDTEHLQREWTSQSTIAEGRRRAEEWICTVAIDFSFKNDLHGGAQPSDTELCSCALITNENLSMQNMAQ